MTRAFLARVCSPKRTLGVVACPVVRDIEIIEEELVGIAAVQDDLTKLERLIAWSSTHPDEVIYAVRFLSGRTKGIDSWIQQHSKNPQGI